MVTVTNSGNIVVSNDDLNHTKEEISQLVGTAVMVAKTLQRDAPSGDFELKEKEMELREREIKIEEDRLRLAKLSKMAELLTIPQTTLNYSQKHDIENVIEELDSEW